MMLKKEIRKQKKKKLRLKRNLVLDINLEKDTVRS